MSSPSSGTPEEPRKASLWQQMPASGRAFLFFWGGCTALAGVVALTLQIMGPPYAEVSGQDIDVGTATPTVLATLAHKTDIPAPMGDLLTDDIGPGGFALPKKGPDGLMPRQVYAAPVVPVPAGNAQVALLIDGIGQADDELSNQAIDALPGPVSLAVSPYASDPGSLMERARSHNHETLLSLPIEGMSAGRAVAGEDAGPTTLRPALSVEKNRAILTDILSHLAGYAGVTNAYSGQTGGEYAQSPAFAPLVAALTQRGLFYLNVPPGTSPDSKSPNGTAPDKSASASPRADRAATGTAASGTAATAAPFADRPGVAATADVVINTDADIVTIDILLLKLQQLARRNGHAIGVMGPLRPVALSCLRAWLPHLKTIGVTLVPVSMLVAPPPAPPPPPKPPKQPTAPEGAVHVQISTPPAGNQTTPAPFGHTE